MINLREIFDKDKNYELNEIFKFLSIWFGVYFGICFFAVISWLMIG